MKKTLAILLVAALAAPLAIRHASAFSLIGPFEAWQTPEVGYNFPLPQPRAPGEAGGPMNLGEEYRWNSPTLVYGFDPSFVEYYGTRAMAEIDKAFKILNDLPPASQMSPDLSEFPLSTRRINHQAAALGIVDLKSWALSAILEGLGLTSPERYAFTLRSRVEPIPGFPIYTTLRRNFDPVTLLPSSYINGTLFTYNIFQTHFNPPEPFNAWEAVEVAVDPINPSFAVTVAGYGSLLAGATEPQISSVIFNPGLFFTGLTRDDAGAIRYLLRSSNFNVETLPTNAIAAFTSGGSGFGFSGGTIPWLPVPTTGAPGQGAGGGQGGIGGGVGGGAGGGATGTNLVDVGLRPGVDKLRFVRSNFDSLLGQSFTNNVVYSDTYLTNGTARQQLIQRTLTQPDILFAAADLGTDQSGAPLLFHRTIGFQNNETLNRTGGQQLGGPGTINSIVITFSKIGPFFRNFGDGGEVDATRGLVYGAFDASTNAPVIFPSEISLRELEQIVMRQGRQLSPWRVP